MNVDDEPVRIRQQKSFVGGQGVDLKNDVLALQRLNQRVGLLDADVYGPNVPLMLGSSSTPRIVDASCGDGLGSGAQAELTPVAELLKAQIQKSGLHVEIEEPEFLADRIARASIARFFWPPDSSARGRPKSALSKPRPNWASTERRLASVASGMPEIWKRLPNSSAP